MTTINRVRTGGVIAAFFLSGAAALIYETLWVRLFSLAFGHTTVAVSAVLAAYMAGLSLGSFIGGKTADRIPSPFLLAIYATLEIMTFLAAIGLKPVIRLLQYGILHAGILNLPPLAQSMIWFIVAFILLIVPTILMGATLPVLMRWVADNDNGRSFGTSAGLLYGSNTLGAVLGALAAGFWTIPALGMTGSFLAAGSLNVFSAALALTLARGSTAPATPAPSPAEATAQPVPVHYLILLTLSGFAAMAAEVAWTRAFASILGSSTYSFTIMLLTFLLGMSLGSIAYGAFERWFRAPSRVLLFIFAAITLSMLLYLPFVNKLPYLFTRCFELLTRWRQTTPLVQFGLCASIMIVPAFFMGQIFPCILSLTIRRRDATGRTTGDLYAVNTLGNIAGSAVTGILLVPWIGAERSLVAAVIVYAACTVLVLWMTVNLRPLLRLATVTAVTAAVTLGIFVRPRWDPYVLASGVFLYSPEYKDYKDYKSFAQHLHNYELLYYRDGISASIAVLQIPGGYRFMRTNGKTDASTGVDMSAQMLQGYVPLLLHAATPKNVLVIGLGSGVTAGALATDRTIGSIDCVEIEPSVVDAARLFSQVNRQVLNDPRLHMIYADARHYLIASQKKYDIITSEPSNPWIAGVASLFTREAFTLAKNRLNDDGIFCQWFHSYSMGTDDFRMVMKTFASVFPDVMLMTSSPNDFLLIGTKQPLIIDYRSMEHRFAVTPAMQWDLAMLGQGHPFTLLATSFLFDDEQFRDFCRSGSLHTDNRPTLEFSAPLHLLKGEEDRTFKSLQAARSALLPKRLSGFDPPGRERAALYNGAGELFMHSRNPEQAFALFQEALRYDPNSARTWTNIGRVENIRDRHLQAEQAFKKAMALDPSYALAWFHIGMLYENQGFEDKALAYLEEGLKKSPYDPMGCLQAGLQYMKKGRSAEAEQVFRRALSRPIINTEIKNSLLYSLNTLQVNNGK